MSIYYSICSLFGYYSAVSELYILCEYDSNDVVTEEAVTLLNSSVQNFAEVSTKDTKKNFIFGNLFLTIQYHIIY